MDAPPSMKSPHERDLFREHFDRARRSYEERRYAESETELEEAYLLRPRDVGVLNLLGLVYFRQHKYEKAEEIYRKLLAQNPDEPTLSYNLGLIYLKLERLEEAEPTFLKALELSGTNPKISFYLGSVYEKLRRYTDAIFHYRHAGADMMARRLEDQIASSRKGRASKPRGKAGQQPSDTAEFKAEELRQSLLRTAEAAFAPPPALGPVSDEILAEAPSQGLRRVSGASRDSRAVPITPPRLRPTPTVAGSAGDAAEETGEPFRFLEPHLIEVDCHGKVFIKQGAIYSYSGDLTFWVKEKRPGRAPALVIVTGRGRLILTDKDREITLMQIDDESLFAAPGHLLACEEQLTPRHIRLEEDKTEPLEFVVLEGRGMLALSAAHKPLSLAVTPDLPVSVPSASVVGWSGSLRASLVWDRQIHEVMHPSGLEVTPLVRLEGSGRVLVEQASARS